MTSLLTEIMADRLDHASVISDRTIDEFLVTDVVGRGSTSIVYKAQRSGSSALVAVKMLKHNLAMDAGFLETFKEESTILAAVQHENIVKVYDIKFLYRTAFIIMEYLHGTLLATMLAWSYRLPTVSACRILTQICFGLAYAHSKGLVHGDIKPGNIFIQEDHCPKIIDFGLACRVGTGAEGVCGTPRYAAPEQLSGEPLTVRSDIYSLGLLAYRIATGHEAFSGTDLGEVLRKKLEEEIPDPRLYNSDLPDNLRNFILHATRKDPSERYSDITQGIKVLES